MTTITYFDFCNIAFSSYFLDGLLKLASEQRFQFKVSREAPEALRDIEDEMRTSWLWRSGSRSEYAVFRYQDQEDFLFCIDASDLNGEDAGRGIHSVLLEQCKYYFKVNYNAKVIAANPSLAPYAHKIIPLPLVFNVSTPQRWRFLPDFIGTSGQRWPSSIIKRRLSWIKSTPKVEQYRQLRQAEKDIDVYFLTFLYPTSWNQQYAELNLRRLSIIDGLNKLSHYKVQAGYVYYSRKNDTFDQYVDKQYQSQYEQYLVPRIQHSTYLDLIARSRVGIYVRGANDCLSFKFGELMALGKPIVGETFLNNQAQLYAHRSFDEQFAFEESEDFVSRVTYLLENPEERQRLGDINEQTFDRELAPIPVMAGVLKQLTAQKGSKEI